MVQADYRNCDMCGNKVFCDRNLNYKDGRVYVNNRKPYRIVGAEQYDNPELLEKYGLRLEYLGDWAVICKDCAKTHHTQIVPIL